MKRRTVLSGGAGLLAAQLAGCIVDSDPGGAQGTEVWTSFFVISEVAGAVAGDAAAVENVVPAGQHGHGWEPSSAVQRDVLTADAFVYVGEGFQPWADDVVETIHEDDADVHVVAARDGVDLLPAPEVGGHDHHDGDDDPHADDHYDADHHEDEDHEDEHDDDGHDHGDHDPHFWLDPLRLGHAVENVVAGLSAAHPDRAETYEANAGDFRGELGALHEEFEARLADRDRDAVLVAGHNAFQYLGHRYGFVVHALTGIAPDAEPSPRDRRRARHVVEDHDIEYVLAPALESDRAANELVEETDAREVLPVTAIAGLTEEWRDRGWGYLDVMREINLASLARALGAE